MGRLPILMFRDLVEMKVHPRYYGCITLVVLSAIVLCFLAYSNDGFVGGIVPDYCGTAGFMVSDGTASLFRDSEKGKRLYTKSECNKVEKGVYDGKVGCYKLKMENAGKDTFSESNIEINYGEKCVGLNEIPSSAPAECMVDGVHVGKNSLAFVENKKARPDNAYRFYTKNECDLLKGKFIGIEDGMKGESSEDIAKAIQANGKDSGLCVGQEMFFSIFCTTNAKPTAASKVGDAAKSALKDWLA